MPATLPSEMNITIYIPFNIFLVLTGLIGAFALLKPETFPTAGALMGWSLFFALITHHVHNHPHGLVASWLEKI